MVRVSLNLSARVFESFIYYYECNGDNCKCVLGMSS